MAAAWYSTDGLIGAETEQVTGWHSASLQLAPPSWDPPHDITAFRDWYPLAEHSDVDTGRIEQ
jgi:hypothetical protein